ncbi:mucin-2-like [Eleginops maclovinus]|uniref:mucin-2-like n=1 Tax=Eleginops maclovinus TaxID=56733 RepID=UPI0030802F5F
MVWGCRGNAQVCSGELMASGSFLHRRAADAQEALQRARRKISDLQNYRPTEVTSPSWTPSAELRDSLVDMYTVNPEVNEELRQRLPSPATQHPSITTQHPSITTQHPSITTQHPSITTQHPSITTQHPSITSTSTQYPCISTQYPCISTQYPCISTQYPCISTQHPSTSTQYPSISTQYPSISTQHPSISTQHPSISTQHPSNPDWPKAPSCCPPSPLSLRRSVSPISPLSLRRSVSPVSLLSLRRPVSPVSPLSLRRSLSPVSPLSFRRSVSPVSPLSLRRSVSPGGEMDVSPIRGPSPRAEIRGDGSPSLQRHLMSPEDSSHQKGFLGQSPHGHPIIETKNLSPEGPHSEDATELQEELVQKEKDLQRRELEEELREERREEAWGTSRSPNPVQTYADDVQERRSGGNRWYQAKKDKPPSFSIMGDEIKVCARHETYCYLGHRFNIAVNGKSKYTN